MHGEIEREYIETKIIHVWTDIKLTITMQIRRD